MDNPIEVIPYNNFPFVSWFRQLNYYFKRNGGIFFGFKGKMWGRNDTIFINGHFIRMAQKKRITFTRSRPYRKNDQAHIEQKNYSTVRKIVGYKRLETEEELNVLNQIYLLLSGYLNFFISTQKLRRKER